ncbi:hypothetical protein HMPREF1981_00816 [Bacteroides pyogenes F0041]|uniref:Uncharacterized protein n=1 Tax=Bacteroides pyogenes F0041 TaxID=1321819 RepID=U2CPW7_9BACE|nr:hypothetical protein HMPREF1981_00816 [Bacteroides pyogenes F0041]
MVKYIYRKSADYIELQKEKRTKRLVPFILSGQLVSAISVFRFL